MGTAAAKQARAAILAEVLPSPYMQLLEAHALAIGDDPMDVLCDALDAFFDQPADPKEVADEVAIFDRLRAQPAGEA